MSTEWFERQLAVFDEHFPQLNAASETGRRRLAQHLSGNLYPLRQETAGRFECARCHAGYESLAAMVDCAIGPGRREAP